MLYISVLKQWCSKKNTLGPEAASDVLSSSKSDVYFAMYVMFKEAK
jgi:hypothetical protein